jgi:unsaturated rhamnogalacturonyl hydrolase
VKTYAVAALILVAGTGSLAVGGTDFFSNWPAGKSPREIGKLVAERFVSSGHLRDNTIIYPETCAWYGALTLAQLSNDKDLTRRLIERFGPEIGSN